MIKEALGFGTYSRRRWKGYAFWGACTVLSFVLTGGRVFTPLRWLADELFDVDKAIRVVALTTVPPKDLVPITLVEIDDATVKHWPMVDITPKKELARVLQVVSSAAPAAVVVDIDLSDVAADKPDALQPEREFRQFLQAYRGPAPIILVRRVTLGDDGSLRGSQNSLVKALVTAPNPRVSWAHALFITDPDGTVRRWQEVVRTCADAASAELLPAVPISVLARAAWADPAFSRPTYAPSTGPPCNLADTERASHVVMFGNRLTGSDAGMASSSIMRVSAWQLTDRRIEREDRALFGGRVVIVGGTHERANDTWRTPVGSMPGMELLANTVRFAAGQLEYDAAPVRRLGIGRIDRWAIVLFVAYLLAAFFLRAFVAVVAALLITGIAMYVGLTVFGFYPVLDVVEISLLLFVQFAIFDGITGLVREGKERRGHRWRWLLLSERFSEDAKRAESKV